MIDCPNKSNQRKGLILVHSSARMESIMKGEGMETSWQQHLEADLATFPSTLRKKKKKQEGVETVKPKACPK